MKQVSDACYLLYNAIGIDLAGDIGIAQPIECDRKGGSVICAHIAESLNIKQGEAIDAAVLGVENEVGPGAGVSDLADVVVITVAINRNTVSRCIRVEAADVPGKDPAPLKITHGVTLKVVDQL